MSTGPLETSWSPDSPALPTLDERADEAARLVTSTLFPDLYDDDAVIPSVYHRIARIIIEAIDEGIV